LLFLIKPYCIELSRRRGGGGDRKEP
jgi:hypothetical protein